MEIIKKNPFTIQLPFRGFLCGPSSAGKSFFMLRLLQNRNLFFNEEFNNVIYCFPCYDFLGKDDEFFLHNMKLAIPNIQITNEIPLSTDLQKLEGHTLLILDDLITHIVNSQDLAHLYSIYSSHCSTSILTTSQNYFEQGKYTKTILRNQTFIVLFETNSDRLSLNMISRQLFPRNSKILENCFQWLSQNISEKYNKYLFINCTTHNNVPNFPQIMFNMFFEIEKNGHLVFKT